MKTGKFTKDDPRINRKGPPKRVAGYKQFLAANLAYFLDSTGEEAPIFQEVMEKYKQDILHKPAYREAFVSKVLMNDQLLGQLDDILQHQKTTDINYLRYLIHLHLFDEQREVLLSRKRQKILVCGRRAGKTETLSAEIADIAVSHSEGTILYISITAQRAFEIIWQRLIGLLDEMRVSYKAKLAPQASIEFASGVHLYLRGASSRDELEKARGDGYLLAIIDEVQSIKDDNLKYLINEILMPGLMQYKGTLILAGTPPRIAGTYLEKEWENAQRDQAKYNWNLTVNPFIADSANALSDIRKQRGLAESDPLYRREYLGLMGVYDLDALVYRLEKPRNYYTDKELWDWIQSQNRTDLWLTGGLDFGFTASDAFFIGLYSASKKEKFLLYEYKKNRESLAELAAAIKTGIDYVYKLPLLIQLVNRDFHIWGDSADPRNLSDLRVSYRLPVVPVKSKSNKALSVERLQDEVRAGNFKIREGSCFEDEARQIIFKRNDNDELTREVDDEYYHPDMADAILYGFRHYWDTTLGVRNASA